MPLPFLHLLRPRKKITDSFGRSDCGMIRQNNEDSFALLPDRRLFLVADGMGGHNAGEVASRMAIEKTVEICSQKALSSRHGNKAAMQHFLIEVFELVNDSVIEAAQSDVDRRGMGTTLTAAYFETPIVHLCHVGDSRCYRLRNGTLSRITTDHVAEISMDTDFGAGKGMKSNAVTRIIGYPFPEDPEYHAEDLACGDRILLCSDGLWSMVDDAEIARIIGEGNDAERCCEKLVEEANAAGGRDNVTAVLIFIG